jgi:lipoprotein-releasing system permease protein
MKGGVVRGIDPAREPQVTDLVADLADTVLPRLVPGAFGVILGGELARSLGVAQGDTVTLIAPSGQVTPAGVVPRIRQMTVVGVFDSGHFEYDSALALLHMDDAARIFRVEGATGVRVKIKDLHAAREVSISMAAELDPGLLVRDWTRQNRTWFAAVQLEKRMMFIILTLIVAVAAFNLVSTLVMTVTDKHADIAILRTLGASPQSIMGIFMVQGRHGGHHRHRAGPGAGPGGGVQHRHPGARAGARTGCQLLAARHLPHQPHAERPAAKRHLADCADFTGAVVCGHHLPELASQPCQSRRGLAL